MRLFLSILLAFCAATFAAPAAEPEDSVYVYEVFQGTPRCPEMEARLKALPLRSTILLSIEQGPEFVLDRPEGEEQLACVLKYLKSGSRKAKLLLLQDPVFLERGEEAVRRAALVSAFNEQHKGLVAGAQVDVEPYTVPDWGCRTAEERRAIMRDLHTLLARVRRNLGGIPLGVVAPWWYPVVRDLPEAGPQELFQVADEIYLMAYGDEGGPVVGGDAGRILARVDAPEFFTGKGRMYVALATYEFRSAEQLKTEMEILRRRLERRPNFAGTALFHATSAFDVPLSRFVGGTVTDAEGKGVPEAEIESGGIKARANRCGQFSLKGLPGAKAELTIRKQGFREKKVQTELSAPGAVRELGNIKMEKE